MFQLRYRSCLVRLPAACALLVSVLTLSACSDPIVGGTAGANSGASPAVQVVTAPVELQSLGLQIEAVGTAKANEAVDVTAKLTNTVVAVRFDEGDFVKRGQVLVELDSAEARAQLEEAEAALAESENQFRRSRDLFTQQALSLSQLDQIEATLKANRARVSAAKARLADTVIRASFEGRTGFRRVSVGSLINPGTVITTLDDTSIINLDFTVPETYLYALQPGLAVTARTAGLPGREFTGVVAQLGARVDPVTRSITVRAKIPNRDGALRPGMFMTVAVEGEPAARLVVPEAAIVPEHGKTYVFAVTDGVVSQREVRTGLRRPGLVEIVAGLEAGERVIVEGTQKVRDGTPVGEYAQHESDGST
jgi:membrane fusion protein (multidrug efflux system)